MKEYNIITFDILKSHKGEYIQLGGRGILNGLNFSPSKFEVWKICDQCIPTGIYMKKYRCRKYQILPSDNFDQQCKIYTLEEYRKMPVYS